MKPDAADGIGLIAANQAEYAWQTAPNDNATMLVPFLGVTLKRHIILGQAVIDYIACLLFFLTCLIKRFRMARPLQKVHASTATIANYTVQITGVPQVAKVSCVLGMHCCDSVPLGSIFQHRSLCILS